MSQPAGASFGTVYSSLLYCELHQSRTAECLTEANGIVHGARRGTRAHGKSAHSRASNVACFSILTWERNGDNLWNASNDAPSAKGTDAASRAHKPMILHLR